MCKLTGLVIISIDLKSPDIWFPGVVSPVAGGYAWPQHIDFHRVSLWYRQWQVVLRVLLCCEFGVYFIPVNSLKK